jgi:hypothetical protein
MPYKDKEKRKEYIKKHRQLNKEKYKIWDKNNYLKHIDERKIKAKIWREKNKEEIAINHKKNWYFKKYGITLEERNNRIQSQNNKCMICGEEFKYSKNIHVDHDHKTGKLRDMLCDYCNGGLGLFRDNVETLQKAINYLIKWR